MADRLTRFGSVAEKAAYLIIPIFVLVVLAVLLAPPLIGINASFQRNYNEGFNFFHALNLARGNPLYGDPWLGNNYPFLSFYVVERVAALTGSDLLLVGRWLSVVGLAAGMASLYWTCRSLGCNAWEALVGTGLGAGLALMIAGGWLGAHDPQFLGQGLALFGLALYASGPDDPRKLIAVAVLLIAAGFIKHNLIAVPLATGIDLLFRSRRRFLIWAFAAAAAAAAMLVLQQAVAGPGFFAEVLGSPRGVDLGMFVTIARRPVEEVGIPLAAALLVAFAGGPGMRLYRLLLVGGFAEILFGVGDGVSFNILIELLFVIGLGCALGLARLRTAAGPLVRTAAALLMTIPLALHAAPLALRLPALRAQVVAAAAQFEADRQWLAGRPGPVICEAMLLCLRAGHDLVLIPYNSLQMIRAGRLDGAELARRITSRQFGAIQLRAAIYTDEQSRVLAPAWRQWRRFPEDILRAVGDHYRLDHVAAGLPRISGPRVFYVPKER